MNCVNDETYMCLYYLLNRFQQMFTCQIFVAREKRTFLRPININANYMLIYTPLTFSANRLTVLQRLLKIVFMPLHFSAVMLCNGAYR